jgi:hypothetical protein
MYKIITWKVEGRGGGRGCGGLEKIEAACLCYLYSDLVIALN